MLVYPNSPPSLKRSMRKIQKNPRTPPSTSHSHIPADVIDINLKDLLITLARVSVVEPPAPLSITHRTKHHNSSISTLPPEILGEIFVRCLPQEQFPVPSGREAPLLLTHVSSQWRKLALSTPELWAALHVDYKDPDEDIPATELWLSRSGCCPLSLSIAIDFNEQPHQDILDLLCKHSHRWRHIRFDFRRLLCAAMYTLVPAHDNLMQLTTFEFHARDISDSNVSQITNLLSLAPQLREVTWVDDLADTETLLELPLKRLTRLSLAMEHGTLDYLQLLNQCSNLEHIRITRTLSNVLQTRPPVCLSKLASLNISYDLTGILDHLILPSLCSVRIYTDDKHTHSTSQIYHSPPQVQSYPHLPLPLPGSFHASGPPAPGNAAETWNPSSLLSLIDRSACTIRYLSISAPMSEDALLLCLKKMSSSIAFLDVKDIVVGDKFVDMLTRRTKVRGLKREVLCPNLEEINLDTQVVCSQGALVAMVSSRFGSQLGDSRLDVVEEESLGREEIQVHLRKMKLLDGHEDIEKLKELSLFVRRPVNSGKCLGGADFSIQVIPLKTSRPSMWKNFVFRRKLCASR